MLCFPRKAFGGKGQRLLGVNALLPQGVHGGKQQLTSRLRGVFRCSGIPGRLRRVQGILCLPGRLAAHAMACRPLLQLLGTHQRRQGGRHGIQLIGQGPAALFLI